jgi:hypothetical protein
MALDRIDAGWSGLRNVRCHGANTFFAVLFTFHVLSRLVTLHLHQSKASLQRMERHLQGNIAS